MGQIAYKVLFYQPLLGEEKLINLPVCYLDVMKLRVTCFTGSIRSRHHGSLNKLRVAKGLIIRIDEKAHLNIIL